MKIPFFNEEVTAFLAVAESRSFSIAAIRLGVTQSAVTKAIARLEKELEVELFDRSCRPIAATEEAIRLLKELSSCRSSLQETAETIREKSLLKPVYRIGGIEILSKCFLPNLFQKLNREASEIISQTAPSHVLLKQLIRHEIDCAFVSNVFAEIKGLSRVKVFEEETIILLPKSYAKQSEAWTWNRLQLLGIPFLHFAHEGGAGRLIDTYMSQLNFKTPNRIEVDSTSSMIALVAKGLGWTTLGPMALLQNPEFLPQVAVVKMPPPSMLGTVYIVSLQGENEKRVKKLIKLSKQIFDKQIHPQIRKLLHQLSFP